jgi:hypothetical protein
MLTHVAETGGRTSDPALQELAGLTSAMLLAEARAGHLDADDAARLTRQVLESPVPDAAGAVLVRAPTWVPGVEVVVVRGKRGDDGDTLQVVRAPSLGLAGLRLERGEGPLRFRLHRQADLEPARAATARIEVLVTDGQGDHPRWVEKEVPLRPDGKDTEVAWDGAALTL